MTGLLVPGPLDERESDRYSQSLPSHWCDDGHAIDPSLRCNINYLELFNNRCAPLGPLLDKQTHLRGN